MMPLNDGYRGSLIWSVTDTIAGNEACTVCDALSPSRRPCTDPSATVTSPAKPTCAHPVRSASIAGTTLIPPSVEAIPVSTRSTARCSKTFSNAETNTRDVAGAYDQYQSQSMSFTHTFTTTSHAL